jgi:Ca2+-binding RTX toxin-like protein
MTANGKLAKRFRPNCESLEARDLLSVTSVVLNAGVLKVTLDNGNDFVRISESSPLVTTATMAAASNAGPAPAPTESLASASLASTALIDDNIIFLGTITVTDATNGATWSFKRSSVQKIEVENHNAFGDVNTIVSTSSLPTTVDLRNSRGTNHVETGAGNDTVFGSEGNDLIWTNAGNDAVAAGAGNDRIDTGPGADSAFGGLGNDDLLDVIASAHANLLYGDGGNDTILSTSRNDVVDGGTEIDTVSVKAGAFVRNVESVTIDVPTGDPITDPRRSSRQATNRFLAAYGLPPRTAAYAVNDSAGLNTSSMYNFVKAAKADVKLNSNATLGTIKNVLRLGKPVISKVGPTWAVITGFNSATGRFTFIGMSGQTQTSPLAAGNRAIIF